MENKEPIRESNFFSKMAEWFGERITDALRHRDNAEVARLLKERETVLDSSDYAAQREASGGADNIEEFPIEER